MRIGFIDTLVWDYDVDTVYERPLGGTQSAAIYLAEALAAQGEEVFFGTCTSRPGVRRGVTCFSVQRLRPKEWQALHLDALIILQFARHGAKLRAVVGDAARLILWSGDASDQAAVVGLNDPAERSAYDAFALVSEWQRTGFETDFGIPRDRIGVMRNAVGLPFQSLFQPGESILAAKARPPVLAYTIAPYRGLDVLLEVFPEIRLQVPGARLQVYSSMRLYNDSEEYDRAQFGKLYAQAKQTEGVEYYGSVPQAELAKRMREVSVLAYPNTCRETSCIALMEAMASGCEVVSSALAGLPETAAGFGRLLPMQSEEGPYRQRFVAAVVEALEEQTGDRAAGMEARLAEQAAFVNREYTWSHRAREWREWLAKVVGE